MPLEPVALSLVADTELEADLEELTVDDLFADDIESPSPTSADAAESERLRTTLATIGGQARGLAFASASNCGLLKSMVSS